MPVVGHALSVPRRLQNLKRFKPSTSIWSGSARYTNNSREIIMRRPMTEGRGWAPPLPVLPGTAAATRAARLSYILEGFFLLGAGSTASWFTTDDAGRGAGDGVCSSANVSMSAIRPSSARVLRAAEPFTIWLLSSDFPLGSSSAHTRSIFSVAFPKPFLPSPRGVHPALVAPPS